MNDQDDADFEDSGSFAAGSVRFLSPEVGLPSAPPGFSLSIERLLGHVRGVTGIGLLRRVRVRAGAGAGA